MAFGTFFHGEDSGGVRRRGMAHAGREPDTQGGIFLRRLLPRAEEPGRDLRAQVAVQFRRGISLARGRHRGHLLHVRRHVGLQRLAQRQSEPAARAAGSRDRAAAGQCPGRRTRRRAPTGPTDPASRDALAAALSEVLKAEGMRLEQLGGNAEGRRRGHHQPAVQRRAAGDRAHGTGAVGGHAGLGGDLPHHHDGGGSRHHHHHRSTAATSRRRSTGRARRSKSWQTAVLEGALPSLGREAWVRDAYPSLDWNLLPAPIPGAADAGGSDQARHQHRSRLPAEPGTGPLGDGEYQPALHQRARRSRARRRPACRRCEATRDAITPATSRSSRN